MINIDRNGTFEIFFQTQISNFDPPASLGCFNDLENDYTKNLFKHF